MRMIQQLLARFFHFCTYRIQLLGIFLIAFHTLSVFHRKGIDVDIVCFK